MVWETLADGEWHSLEDVIAEAGQAVPPGRAYRKAAGGRDHDDKVPVTGSGKRMIVQEGIRSLVRSGRLERRQHPVHPQSVQVRRGPAVRD